MQKLQLLGNITPAQFLRDYWHKKPLLIRQAIPDFKPLLKFDKLAELARQNHVESRLVTLADGKWDMQHGPLAELPPRSQREWTMLVQGINLHRTQSRRAAAPVPLRAGRAPGRPDGQLRHAMAAASARTSIPTTCSCCRRRAGAAGASAPSRT